AGYRDLFVYMSRFNVAVVTSITGGRPQESPGDVVERHIVSSRHDEVPRGQRIEESSGAAKLSAACALRQIAGDHDEVRAKLRQYGLQRADQCLVDAAEVQVRQMRQHAHGVDFSATPPRHSRRPVPAMRWTP